MKPWLTSLLLAAAATAAVLATLGPERGGPGVTCDELYHVGLAGKPLVTAVRHQGLTFFTPENVRRNFAWPAGGPPVQAPLGHWILGFTHHLFDPAPDNPGVLSIGAARVAPAVAFGLLVFLVGQWTWRRAGRTAGVVAAMGVVLMPRVFAHAHFAALDMLTTVACAAALFMATWAARPAEDGLPHSRLNTCGRFALAGSVWGMAMLIRLHGVLLLPPIALWLLWQSGVLPEPWRGSGHHDRRLTCRATGSLVWFTAGLATLWLGWPWLWLNPVENLGRYLSSGADRHVVHVFYLGQVWADHQAPWHYPLLMSLWTVPVGFLALGLFGIRAWLGRFRTRLAKNLASRSAVEGSEPRPTRSDPRRPGAASDDDIALIALAGMFLPAVFAWPGVPVYDGVRLFLIAFPLWAIFAGLGAKWLVEGPLLPRVSRQARVAAIGLLIAFQATGVVWFHPIYTSYYNLLAGGLWGSDHLGLETTYWGDSVREPMLAEAARRAPGQPVLFGPNLAPFQAPAVEMSSLALAEAETKLVGWDASRPEPSAPCKYALVYRRRADLATIDWVLREGKVVAEYGKQGVWITRLVRIPSRRPPRRAEPGG